MHDFKWTDSEKKMARNVFNACLNAELGEILEELKAKAVQAVSANDIWEIEAFLTKKRHDIDEKYDFRYSQIIYLFARLIQEGRLHEDQLGKFSAEKLSFIHGITNR